MCNYCGQTLKVIAASDIVINQQLVYWIYMDILGRLQQSPLIS